jgi:hypothetical protein
MRMSVRDPRAVLVWVCSSCCLQGNSWDVLSEVWIDRKNDLRFAFYTCSGSERGISVVRFKRAATIETGAVPVQKRKNIVCRTDDLEACNIS